MVFFVLGTRDAGGSSRASSERHRRAGQSPSTVDMMFL